eukprot:4269304-Ditylum_brightwellii.AAC.1
MKEQKWIEDYIINLENKKAILEHLEGKQNAKESSRVGSSITTENNAFHLCMLWNCYMANMSLLQLKTFSQSLGQFLKKGYKLGEVCELGRSLTGDVEKIELNCIYKIIQEDYYPEYSTISDGTPKGISFWLLNALC